MMTKEQLKLYKIKFRFTKNFLIMFNLAEVNPKSTTDILINITLLIIITNQNPHNLIFNLVYLLEWWHYKFISIRN